MAATLSSSTASYASRADSEGTLTLRKSRSLTSRRLAISPAHWQSCLLDTSDAPRPKPRTRMLKAGEKAGMSFSLDPQSTDPQVIQLLAKDNVFSVIGFLDDANAGRASG